MAGLDGDGPRVAVAPMASRRSDGPGAWLFTWEVRNLDHQGGLTVEAAWLPHGRFRGDRQDLPGGVEVPAGGVAKLELPVRCAEPPRTVVENGFVILRVRWRDVAWRVLTRLRVTFDAHGTPLPEPEVTTVQRVGFSED